MPETHRLPMLPRSDDTLATLLRYILRTTRTMRGRLSVVQDGIVAAAADYDGTTCAATGHQTTYDTIDIPLDDRASAVIVSLERPVGQTQATQLPEALWDLLREQIPQLLDSRATAAALVLERRKTASIVDDALEPYLAMDHHGVVCEWNRAASATFGWSREEAIGQFTTDLIVPHELREQHPGGFDYFQDGVSTTLIGQRLTLPALRRDGSTIIVELRVTVQNAAEGNPILHAFLRDVTDVEETRQRLARSENLLREAQQIVALGSTDYDFQTGRIFCSDEFFRIVGIDKETFDGTTDTLDRLIHPDDAQAAITTLRAAFATNDPHDIEHRVIRPDGRTIVIRRRGYAVFNDHGAPIRVFSTVQDVTDQRRAEAERLELEGWSAEAFNRAPFGMSMVCARADNYGVFMSVNAAYCTIIGYSQHDVIGKAFTTFIEPADVQIAFEATEQLLSGQSDVVHYELRMLRHDGTSIWVRQTRSLLRDACGEAQYFFTHSEDITKRKAAEEKLEHQTYHDALTGVLNRRGLTLEIKRRFAESAAGTQAALLLLDLDHFKYVNDTMGHGSGDRVLRQVATILGNACSNEAIITRLGGDEFVVIVPHATEEQAIVLADGIRAVIQSKVYLSNDLGLRATASIGIVLMGSLSQPSIAEALNAADSALLTAKAQGRNRSSVARTLVSSHSEMKAELTWSQRIRHALEHELFALYAQPILNLRSGIVDRYELLLRMIDPDGTVILPGEFLPVAERSGLMPEIDCWVVKGAIALAAAQQAAGRQVMFEVNLSGASLTNESVTTCIENELRTTAVNPRALIFEITETAAIGNMDLACAFAQKIREIGCGVALDDFGAGFSSFYYLKYLPFDHLKIDGEFIRNLTTNVSDQHIVRAIVELAHGLGKETIAEFVGDADTAVLLQEYGVDFAQGYYIGKPTPWAAEPLTLEPMAALFA